MIDLMFWVISTGISVITTIAGATLLAVAVITAAALGLERIADTFRSLSWES